MANGTVSSGLRLLCVLMSSNFHIHQGAVQRILNLTHLAGNTCSTSNLLLDSFSGNTFLYFHLLEYH